MLRYKPIHQPMPTLVWEKNLQGLTSWAWPPKFCRTPKVLQNLSSTSFLLCETFCRTFLQNPKGTAEFWGTFGSPSQSFQALQILLPSLSSRVCAYKPFEGMLLMALFYMVLSWKLPCPLWNTLFHCYVCFPGFRAWASTGVW